MQPSNSAFTFIFEDERWTRKLGVLLLLSFVPGLNLIAWMGYTISIAHNVLRGAKRPLPDWQDWADILARGLMSLSASLVIFIPVFALVSIGFVFNAAGVGAALLCALLLSVFGVMFTLAVLASGHIRYARSDRHQDYYDVRGRLSDLRRFAGLYGSLVLTQFLVAGLSLLLALALAVTLVGPFIVFTIASAANGHLIGMAARQARRAQPIPPPPQRLTVS
jgi:hypothetical protein